MRMCDTVTPSALCGSRAAAPVNVTQFAALAFSFGPKPSLVFSASSETCESGRSGECGNSFCHRTLTPRAMTSPMCSKSLRQPDLSVKKTYGTPNTSGCYSAVQENARPLVHPSGEHQAVQREASPVELRVVCQGQDTAPVYEIWTERTVYEFDRSLSCTAVRDVQSGTMKLTHPCVGAQLLGGRNSQGPLVHVSSPLPAVGHNALLGDDEHPMTVTSPVTRVVMNLCRWSCAATPPHALEK